MKKRILKPFALAGLLLGLAVLPSFAEDAAAPNAPADNSVRAINTNMSLTANSPSMRAQWQKKLTLGPGDLLNFVLFDQPELSRRDVPIGPDGRVTFLQAEDVMATGLTIDELRSKFDDALGKYYRNARTIITPSAYRSKKFFLLGSVVTKGVFPLDRPTTMIQAIAGAGGLETGLFEQNTVELADLSHSFIIRQSKRLPVDFEKLFQQGDLTQNIALEPDDYIYFASASANEIFVVGAVNGPGLMNYTPNATVMAAITARGGFADKAYQSRVLVIRGSLNKPETFVVNTKAILGAESPDFKLQPKDIVYVARRPWARAEEILDAGATAFIQAALVTWTGQKVGPIISTPIF
ncbi:MAG: hypothetical protein HOP33_14975 [Verrucomicrobia bacterium]|nr:hypothetical protein [Verrucomicrobiota bacterium]